ncbi:MAG: hypothetical protein D6718_01295 [Acidobacteria bacterium]|nr:MAG: hypothetical protein D6718_01295 [Acidobacteriota bacterium]
MSEERERFTGRDLAEALAAARKKFGLARRDIGYEVLHRPVVGPLDEPGSAMVEIEAWPQPGARPAPDTGAREERPRRDRGRKRGAAAEDLPPLVPGPEVTDPRAVVEHVVRALVTGFDLDLEIDGVTENEVGMRVNLVGADASLLTEDEAAGLDALQYVVNRILLRDGRRDAAISIDAAGYRAKHEAELIEQAKRFAEEVRRTGQRRRMPPLGPYERRVVHLALAREEGIRTFSTGKGFKRQLNIAPKRGS